MAVFNSLGSNYKTRHLVHMFTGFDAASSKLLVGYLAERYDANAQLTYKGREALYLAIKNLKLKKSEKVAINGYTCYAVYDAVTAAGHKPVYIDVDKEGLNFSAKSLTRAVKDDPKIKAVIIQNTLGFPADIKSIEDLCHKKKIHLIEDLAHSVGMHYEDGREAGSVADAALSFSQDKAVDAVSGGAYIYRGSKQEFKQKRLSYFRFLKDYYYIWNTIFIRSGYIWGGGKIYNYILRKLHFLPRPMDGRADNVRRPDHWHASLALKQFKVLDGTIEHRRQIADIYNSNLPEKVRMKSSKQATYLRYPIQVDDPASLIEHLRKASIYVSDTWYESPISPARCIGDTNYKKGSCPNAEAVASRMVNLPTHVNVETYQAEKITEKVNQWLSQQK